MPRTWTQQEINLLLSKKRVPNRSKKSKRRKLIQLGIIKPRCKIAFKNKIKWTQKEIDLLKNNLENQINRSKDSIRSMKRKLGIYKTNRKLRPWFKKEEKLLQKLIKENKTLKEIFSMKIFPYSKTAIQKKLSKMGLTKKGPNQIKLDKQKLAELKNFLKENWKKSPDELVILWNSKNKTKINKNKVIYHLRQLNLKISLVELNKNKKLIKIEDKIKKMSFSSSKQLEEKIRLERKKIMMERLEKRLDIWTGLKINEEIEEDEIGSYAIKDE